MAYLKALFLGVLMVTGSLGYPLPQTSQLKFDEVYQAYSPGQYIRSEPSSQLVATKNGQLVRAYPASSLKRLRLVPVQQGQGAGQGQVLYTVANPGESLGQRARPQELQSTYIPQQSIAYRSPTPVPVISPQQPRPNKTLYRAKPALPQKVVQQQEDEAVEEDEYPADPNPQYNFSFDVKDDELTNYQNRQEERHGGVIKGSYSVVDPDGYVRTVTYTADSKNGFQAKVVREPTDVKVKFPVPTPAPEEPQLKPQAPLRSQYPQVYGQAQPQVYTQGTHLQPTYVLRRVPANEAISGQPGRYVKVLRNNQ